MIKWYRVVYETDTGLFGLVVREIDWLNMQRAIYMHKYENAPPSSYPMPYAEMGDDKSPGIAYLFVENATCTTAVLIPDYVASEGFEAYRKAVDMLPKAKDTK